MGVAVQRVTPIVSMQMLVHQVGCEHQISVGQYVLSAAIAQDSMVFTEHHASISDLR